MARDEKNEVSMKTQSDQAELNVRKDMNTEIERPPVREIRLYVMTANGCAMPL